MKGIEPSRNSGAKDGREGVTSWIVLERGHDVTAKGKIRALTKSHAIDSNKPRKKKDQP